ncbi:polysaccharide deacetylase family protein [Candidatus Peregrinibacteria bacterium]|nr:MAG: polysaccharide deacetylase family protein [Candidatus Peregrinibacteria bacterium]
MSEWKISLGAENRQSDKYLYAVNTYTPDLHPQCNEDSDTNPKIETFTVAIEESSGIGILAKVSDTDNERLHWEIDFGDSASKSGDVTVGRKIQPVILEDQFWGCTDCSGRTLDACDIDSFLDNNGGDHCYSIQDPVGIEKCTSDETREIISVDITQGVNGAVGSCEADPRVPGTDEFKYTIMCNTPKELSATHTYQKSGTYIVTLTVTDLEKNKTIKTKSVTIGGDDDGGDDDGVPLAVSPTIQSVAVGETPQQLNISGGAGVENYVYVIDDAGGTGIGRNACTDGTNTCSFTKATTEGEFTMTVSDGGESIGVTIEVTADSDGGTACHLWENESDIKTGDIPDSFASPLDHDKKNTVTVDCQETSAKGSSGNDPNKSTHIVWETAWISKGGSDWTKSITLTGDKSLDSENGKKWFVGTANFSETFTKEELEEIQYIAVYQCDYNATDEKWEGSGNGTRACGCTNDECANSGLWTLQAFQKGARDESGDPAITITADPTSLNNSGNTVLKWNTENIGADWTCTASGGAWSGKKDPLGDTTGESVAVSETTTFTLTCVPPEGTQGVTGTLRVEVLTGADSLFSEWGVSTDQPFVGDMNGDGIPEVGVKRGSQWFFDFNNNGLWDDCSLDGCISNFGTVADKPIIGDWNGDGTDEIGVLRDKQWLLDMNGNGEWNGCITDKCVIDWGVEYDAVAVGDTNGDNIDEVGIKRRNSENTNDVWRFDTNNNGEWDGCSVDTCFSDWGIPFDTVFLGDWNGNGSDAMGLRQGSKWFLDFNNNGRWDGCETDKCYEEWGLSSDTPLVGDWNEDGADEIGAWQNGQWLFDLNGNGTWDGAPVLTALPLSQNISVGQTPQLVKAKSTSSHLTYQFSLDSGGTGLELASSCPQSGNSVASDTCAFSGSPTATGTAVLTIKAVRSDGTVEGFTAARLLVTSSQCSVDTDCSTGQVCQNGECTHSVSATGTEIQFLGFRSQNSYDPPPSDPSGRKLCGSQNDSAQIAFEWEHKSGVLPQKYHYRILNAVGDFLGFEIDVPETYIAVDAPQESGKYQAEITPFDSGNIAIGDAVRCGFEQVSSISPSCGSANGGNFPNSPTDNLCSAGALSWIDQSATDGTYNWQCVGTSTTVSCEATKLTLPPVDPPKTCSSGNSELKTIDFTGSALSQWKHEISYCDCDLSDVQISTARVAGSGQTPPSVTLKQNINFNSIAEGQCDRKEAFSGTSATGGAYTTYLSYCKAGGKLQIKHDVPAASNTDPQLHGTAEMTCESSPTGTCGSANGGNFPNSPTDNLCSAGALSWIDQSATDGTYNWQCVGTSTTVSCEATKLTLPPVDPPKTCSSGNSELKTIDFTGSALSQWKHEISYCDCDLSDVQISTARVAGSGQTPPSVTLKQNINFNSIAEGQCDRKEAFSGTFATGGAYTTYLSYCKVGGKLQIKHDVPAASNTNPQLHGTAEMTCGGGSVVSLSFDDGWISHYTTALPLLQEAGFKGTFYIITNAISSLSNLNFVENADFSNLNSQTGFSGWVPQHFGSLTANLSSAPDRLGATTGYSAKVEVVNPSGNTNRWAGFVPQTGVLLSDYVSQDGGNLVAPDFDIRVWYKSTVPVKIYAQYDSTDNSKDHIEVIKNLDPTTDWSMGTAWFRASSADISDNSMTVKVFAGIGDAGTLFVDDIFVTRSTFYVNPSQILEIQNAGHEIGSHTKTHPDLTLISDAKANEEITDSRNALVSIGVPHPDTFAYPFGSKNDGVKQKVQSAGYLSARGVDRGENPSQKPIDLYNLQVQQVDRETSLEQVKTWIDNAATSGKWLILMFHDINDATPASGTWDSATDYHYYGSTPSALREILQYLKQKNTSVKTILEMTQNISAS